MDLVPVMGIDIGGSINGGTSAGWRIFWGTPHDFRKLQMDIDESVAGGIPTPLKNMSSSVGMMKFPILYMEK